MRAAAVLACGLWLAVTPALAASSIPADPLGSVMWETLYPEVFGTAPVVADARVVVMAPADVENARAMPIAVDATALEGVEEIVIVADLNPFPVVLRYEPLKARPFIATRIKIQQATAVRAAARTRDGVWHMNGRLVDAAGGGCAAPPASYAAADWSEHLGEVQARVWPTGDTGAARVKLRIRHPQDTGLMAGVPAFFIDALTLTDAAGTPVARLAPLEPVSEDPVFTLVIDAPVPGSVLTLKGRDNNGGEIAAAIPVPVKTAGATP